MLKIGEEKGEVSEAVLNVTSPHNGKNKTWDDVREELADCFIVAIDIALTFDIDMGFDFHVRHLENFDEKKFSKKILSSGKIIASLDYTLDCLLNPPAHDHDISDSKNLSKDLARLFFELATLVFPDKEDSDEVDISNAFHMECGRKIDKWNSKMTRNVVDDGTT